MALNFNKKISVGVSITPEMGLEVAQVDFATGTLLKYGCRQLSYDINRAEIADMDIFKETLEGLLLELDIPKGAELSITLPAAYFGVNDYPASLDDSQIYSAVEEVIAEAPCFKDSDPNITIAELPNSTLQFKKVVYTGVHRVMLIELAMQIKELGYSLVGIDTSVNASVNAMFYCRRIDAQPDFSWVMLFVENNFCNIIPMQGSNYVDFYSERVGIGEVLEDSENYSTVMQAVAPTIAHMPSQRLYVISKTNIISAKALASKLDYTTQIIHEDVNCFAAEPILQMGPYVDAELAKSITLDVIGAAIYRDFVQYSNAKLNLFNEGLGDIYLSEQPPIIKLGNKKIELTNQRLIKYAMTLLLPLIIIVVLFSMWINQELSLLESRQANINNEIVRIDKFLKENATLSANEFDEADEVRIGLEHNKKIHSYYLIVGTEIPKKLWLTALSLGTNTTIEGQADNLESIYSFFRNVKDYNPGSGMKLQKLGLASKSNLASLSVSEEFDTDSILNSMTADFYQFKISDAPEEKKAKDTKKEVSKKNKNGVPFEQIK